MLELQPHYLLVTALGSWLAVTSSRATAGRARNSSQNVRTGIQSSLLAHLLKHITATLSQYHHQQHPWNNHWDLGDLQGISSDQLSASLGQLGASWNHLRANLAPSGDVLATPPRPP